MSAIPAVLGGPLAGALAAAGDTANQRLQQLAAPADSASAKAAALADEATQLGTAAAPMPAAPTAAALAQIAGAFSPAQPAATPGSPCGCGDHLPSAFDRASAEQALLAGLGAAAANDPLSQDYEDKLAALADQAQQQGPAGVPSPAIGGLLQQAAQARQALAQSWLAALPAPLRDALGGTLPGVDAAKPLLDDALAAAGAPSPSAALLGQFASAIGGASDDAIRRAAAMLPR